MSSASVPDLPLFAGVKACVFDAYGTLFDVAAAARGLRDEIGPQWEALAALWRDKQLQYTWLRSLMGRYDEFRVVTAEALDYALTTLKVEADSDDLRRRLLDLYDHLEAYPEVPAVLTALRSAGCSTAILSNGSPRMLAAAVETAGLGALLDDVLSVDPLKVYKPDPRVYQLALDRFSGAPQDIAFFSSNGWDAAGAAAFGFRVVWVNRFGQPQERLPAHPEVEVATLAAAPHLFPA